MATLAYFRAHYPEFDDPVASDALVQQHLDDAELFVIEGKWGKWYDLGHAAYAAHTLELRLRRQKAPGGSQSPLNVQSKSAGGLSVSYNTSVAATAGEVWYMQTPYGTEYWRLLQIVGISAAFVISPCMEV